MSKATNPPEDLLFGYTKEEMIDVAVDIGINLLIALVILFIGLRLAKFFSKMVRKILEKRGSDKGLISFMGSLVNGLIKVLTIVTVFSQVGIEMTSFIAILGAAGLAIGMAFSGTLSNFAGGVIILMLKPFKVGDYIEAQGESGSVTEIQIFHTILLTPDNKTIILPNGPVSTGNVTNYSAQDTRRVDFTFGFSYGENFDLARKSIMEAVNSNSHILKDPEPFVRMDSLGDSSVNVKVKVWVKSEDYWEVYHDINEKVYEKFEGTDGISMPFPQMDVHLDKVD